MKGNHAFKHQSYRLYRLCWLRFEKVAENSTDKTDETIYTRGSLSSAVAYVEICPVRFAWRGFFLGAISSIFSMMISERGLSGSKPQ